MKRSVFFSWQIDTDQQANRYLIRDALKAACARLSNPCEFDEATRGVPGSPSIFETILQKIDQSAVFVGDISLVTEEEARRHNCNPNVHVEYGYALARLTPSRIVPVLNKHYGPPERLPFDLRHKGVRVIYDLPPNGDREIVKQVKSSLEGRLYSELRLILEDPKSVFGLSANEASVAEYILRTSQLGTGRSTYRVDKVAEGTGIEFEAVNSAITELVSREYLERLEVLDTDAPPVKARHSLFWDLDVFVKGWDPREDAKTIAKALVSKSGAGNGRLGTRDLSQRQNWPLRRLNPAVRYLVASSIVRASNEVDPELVTTEIYETEPTRAFLRGEFDPDALRRGVRRK
jgi:hypothetical protein